MVWATSVTQTTHPSLIKRDLTPTQSPPYPLKTTHICLYNYLISVHVQPQDGQHQWPKHVVVPNVVKYLTYYQ